jgi:hypothetical protein
LAQKIDLNAKVHHELPISKQPFSPCKTTAKRGNAADPNGETGARRKIPRSRATR